MAIYYKPQSPIQSGKDFIYPITTADQVILADGSRLEKNGIVSANVATAANSEKLDGRTLAEIMLALYPVGAVYISANSTSPASLFGGTWESIGGRFLLGADATYKAGSTGGEATHTLTEEEMPRIYGEVHMHGEGAGGSVIASVSGAFTAITEEPGYDNSASVGSIATSVSAYKINVGGDQSHNNMPPYLAVYMWKRVS